jgi:DNA-cytosine methyltransferase
LFYDIVRILEARRSKAFLLENVKNLKSHYKGRTFKIISEVLKELDYITFDQIINAKHYVPQHRERIFIAGFSKEYYNDSSYSNSLKHQKKKHGFVVYLLKIRIQDIRLPATFGIICRTTQRSIKKKETDLVLGL